MSLTDVIKRLSQDYSVIRTLEGSYIDGRYTAGTSSIIILNASIQSSTGRDEQTLEDAEHAEEMRDIWSYQEFFPRAPGHEPDIFLIDGEKWEVSVVGHHFHRPPEFWKGQISREALP